MDQIQGRNNQIWEEMRNLELRPFLRFRFMREIIVFNGFVRGKWLFVNRSIAIRRNPIFNILALPPFSNVGLELSVVSQIAGHLSFSVEVDAVYP